jgi:predicted DNA-binding transcriptional regulator YafY
MDDQLKRQEMRVSIAEAAERLRLSEQTVRRRVRSGELPGVQLNTPQGFIWMVELPDDLSTDNPDSGEIKALRELIDTLRAQGVDRYFESPDRDPECRIGRSPT